MLAKEKAEEELREFSDAVEMATLDKEMAEERVRVYANMSEYNVSGYTVWVMIVWIPNNRSFPPKTVRVCYGNFIRENKSTAFVCTNISYL